MRLVERVRGKGFPISPNLLDKDSRIVIFRKVKRLAFDRRSTRHELRVCETPFDELRLQFGHDVHELLAHGLTKLVGFAARKASKVS